MSSALSRLQHAGRLRRADHGWVRLGPPPGTDELLGGGAEASVSTP